MRSEEQIIRNKKTNKLRYQRVKDDSEFKAKRKKWAKAWADKNRDKLKEKWKKKYHEELKYDVNFKEKQKTSSRKYIHRHFEKNLFNKAKGNAKKHGRKFNLSLEDIIIPETCPVMGVPFIIGNKKYSPSIDRIDTSKGYIKGNIQIISLLANTTKSHANNDELKKFGEWAINQSTV